MKIQNLSLFLKVLTSLSAPSWCLSSINWDISLFITFLNSPGLFSAEHISLSLCMNTTFLVKSSSRLFFSQKALCVPQDSLWWSSLYLLVVCWYKRPQRCCWADVADEHLLCLLDVLIILSQDKCVSLGVAVLRLSSRTGDGAQMSPVGPPALSEHKVVVGGGAHGIKYIGFVRDLELWGRWGIEIYFLFIYFYFSFSKYSFK